MYINVMNEIKSVASQTFLLWYFIQIIFVLLCIFQFSPNNVDRLCGLVLKSSWLGLDWIPGAIRFSDRGAT
jgi:hypothetical protein